MRRVIGVDGGEFIEELLYRRSIQGIPRTVKYSMTDSDVQKDLQTVLKKLSNSEKMQRDPLQETVHLSPRKFIRVALVISAFMLLIAVSIYHVAQLGNEGYTQQKTLPSILKAKQIQNNMAVVLQEMAGTMEIYLRHRGNHTNQLINLHEESDKKLRRKMQSNIDCADVADHPLKSLPCVRKIALSRDGNISEIVLEYESISKHLHDTMIIYLLATETLQSYVPFVIIDKVSRLGIHFLTAVTLSMSACNITSGHAEIAESEANMAMGCLESIHARQSLTSIRGKIYSGIKVVRSRISKTVDTPCDLNYLNEQYNVSALFPITNDVMDITTDTFRHVTRNVNDVIRHIKRVKIIYSVFIVMSSLAMFSLIVSILHKEKLLEEQKTTIETLKDEYRKQSEETERCLNFFVPREFFERIPSDTHITVIMDNPKMSVKGVQSEKSQRRGNKLKLEKSDSVFQSISDWTRRLIQRKKNTGKYSCPEKPVAVQRDHISTTLQMKTVTVFKSDIVKFNRLLQYCTPGQLTNIVTSLMEIFDERIRLYDVYVLNRETDSYTVVSGICEKQKSNHASEIANMALDVMNACSDLEIERIPDCKLRMRVGVHTGTCFETLSGLANPRFCIHGDVVKMADKLQKTSIPNGIHISESTYSHLHKNRMYNLQKKGKTDLQNGKSTMSYWLLGRRVSVCHDDRRHGASQYSLKMAPMELEMKAVYDYDSEEKGYIPARSWMMHRYSLDSMSDGTITSASSQSFSRRISSTLSMAPAMSLQNVHEILDESVEIHSVQI